MEGINLEQLSVLDTKQLPNYDQAWDMFAKVEHELDDQEVCTTGKYSLMNIVFVEEGQKYRTFLVKTSAKSATRQVIYYRYRSHWFRQCLDEEYTILDNSTLNYDNQQISISGYKYNNMDFPDILLQLVMINTKNDRFSVIDLLTEE